MPGFAKVLGVVGCGSQLPCSHSRSPGRHPSAVACSSSARVVGSRSAVFSRISSVNCSQPLVSTFNKRTLNSDGLLWNSFANQFACHRYLRTRLGTGSAWSCLSERVTIAGKSIARKDFQIALVALPTVLLAASNKILYKMALVPLKEFPFFFAQITTFGYVFVYFTILYFRYRAGIVTQEMLSLPKARFAAMGACEALSIASGMAAAAVLPAACIPVLLQMYLVWQFVLSATLLGKRYSPGEIVGCLLVVAGVITVVYSGGGGGGLDSLQQRNPFWLLVMVVSAFFSAGSSVLKEGAFKDAAQRLKGGSVDIFVVNSFGSGFQVLFVLLLLPFLSKVRGIPFSGLPMHFRDGAACFLNTAGVVGKGCDGAPLLPLLYAVVNMSFNISVLALMKLSSAIVASLCTTLAVPLSIFVFTLPLPYLGKPPPATFGLWLGSTILVAGLAAYNVSGRKVEQP